MLRIRPIRDAQGLSLMQLSRDTGVSRRTLQDWEAGISEPKNLYSLARIARRLGCHIEDFLDPDLIEGNPEPQDQ